MTETSARRNLPLLIVLAVSALVVIVSLIAVFTRSAPAPLDPNSPEGVVQTYMQAVIDDDLTAARALLTAELRENCQTSQPSPPTGVRITHVRTIERTDEATVTVDIGSPGGGGLFGPSDYVSRESFELARTDEGWRIAVAPWQFETCWEAFQ